jgi:hypothetical protein
VAKTNRVETFSIFELDFDRSRQPIFRAWYFEPTLERDDHPLDLIDLALYLLVVLFAEFGDARSRLQQFGLLLLGFLSFP